MTLESVLAVSGVIFAIGLYGALSKRSAVVVLMCLELMFKIGAVMGRRIDHGFFRRFHHKQAVSGGHDVIIGLKLQPDCQNTELIGFVHLRSGNALPSAIPLKNRTRHPVLSGYRRLSADGCGRICGRR